MSRIKLSKNFWEIIKISVSGGGFLIASLVAFRQCNQDSKFEEYNFNISALQYRPIIEIIDQPWAKNHSFKFNPQHLFDKIQIPMAFPKDSIKDISVESFDVLLRTKVRNSGNAISKLVLIVGIDTITDSPVLRSLLKNNFRPHKLIPEYFKPEFKSELLPGDSTIIDYKVSLQLRDTINIFNYHFLILYENELGQLFDTYLWAMFENVPTIYQPEFLINPSTNKLFARFKLHDDPASRFKCTVNKTYNYIYTREETERINAFLDTHQVSGE